MSTECGDLAPRFRAIESSTSRLGDSLEWPGYTSSAVADGAVQSGAAHVLEDTADFVARYALALTSEPVARRVFALVALAFALLVLTSTHLQAQSFSPVYPTTATIDVSFPYSEAELEQDINDSSHYANQILDRRYIFANRNIKNISVSGAGYMENSYDSVTYGWADQTPSTVTGTLSPSTWLGQSDRAGSAGPFMQATGYVFTTHADQIVSSTGYTFTTARVVRHTSPQTNNGVPARLFPFVRNQVLMLGQGDVVHLRVLPQYRDSTVVTWPGTNTGAYGMIYARCGARPTQTAFDFAATRTTGANVLFLPAGSCPSATSDWYVAIVSPVGNRGVVNVVTHTQATSQSLNLITVDVEGSLSAAMRTKVLNLLREAAWQQFGMSEGIIPIRNFNVHFGATCAWHPYPYVCLRIADGRSFADDSYIELFGKCNAALSDCPKWTPRVLAHEFMHMSAGTDLPDEYTDVMCTSGSPPLNSYDQCGHTAMANNGFNINSVCVGNNHGSNSYAGLACDNHTVPAQTGASGWERIEFFQSANPIPSQTWTPDNFDYRSWFWSHADEFTIGRIASVI